MFTHAYKEVGTYILNISAYNLHSEPYGFNKYTHNMSRILQIQMPVINWELNLGDPPRWLDENGGWTLSFYKVL